MKKIILLSILLSLFFGTSYAQPSFPTRISNNISLNDARVTTKTATSSIHPPDVGYGIDSAFNLMNYLYSLISGSGNLQAVTTIGATTNHSMTVDDGVNWKTTHGAFSTTTYTESGTVLTDIGVVSGKPGMSLKDNTSANYGQLQSGNLTALRTWLGPDEGNGSGLNSTFVLHRTKYPTAVDDGAGDSIHTDPNRFEITMPGSGGYKQTQRQYANYDFFGIQSTSSGAYWGNRIHWYPTVGNLYDDSIPQKSGTFAMLSDITGAAIPLNEVAFGTGTSITADPSFTYDISSGYPNLLVEDNSGNRYIDQNGNNSLKIGAIDGGTAYSVYELFDYVAGNVQTGDISNLVNGVKSIVDVQYGYTLMGDPSGVRERVDVANQAIQLYTTYSQFDIDGVNKTVKAGDLSLYSNGQQLLIDAYNNKSALGDIENDFSGLQLLIDAAGGKGYIGDPTGASNGLGVVVDIGSNIISLGPISDLSSQMYLNVDVHNEDIIEGDAYLNHNGLQHKVDVLNNVISDGDLANLSTGIRLEVNPGTQDVAIRDAADGITNGTGIDVDFGHNKIDIGTPYGFGGLVGESLNIATGHITNGDPLHIYNTIVGMYQDIDLSTSSIKEGDINNHYNGFASKLDVANQTFDIGTIYGTSTNSSIHLDSYGEVIKMGNQSGFQIDIDGAAHATYIGDVLLSSNNTVTAVDDLNKVNWSTNSVAYPTMKISTATSGTVVMSSDARGYYINPPSTASTLSIQTPNTATKDGEEMLIIFGGTIPSGTVVTTLSIATGSFIGNIVSPTVVTSSVKAGYCIHIKYLQSLNRWYVY